MLHSMSWIALDLGSEDEFYVFTRFDRTEDFKTFSKRHCNAQQCFDNAPRVGQEVQHDIRGNESTKPRCAGAVLWSHTQQRWSE